VVILGGHTIDDPEPKYGLSVTGSVHPDLVVTNAGASPGDRLVLTKPLGTGIIGTAIKRGSAQREHVDIAVESMATLNKAAADAMVEVGVNACTDVTGYGLLGHLLNIADASRVTIEIDLAEVPFLPGVWDYIDRDIVPGGTERNLDSLRGLIRWPQNFGEAGKIALADAQTSGGLVIVAPEKKIPKLRSALKTRDIAVRAEIGRVVPRGDFPLAVFDR
jgi:selenide,water dikinase